ncbi:ABC transporter permease [Clostridium gasigenes]|uniref:ABC transporter permease n=1 Tax=Clostridium gasigenes TaxID=94869 RepID=UPI001C0C8138|nr:ABC transporter permease [Clostridium gasigenes]MBU3090263.1 ABC transporter permease [Clostridium gasigenes]
MDLRNFWKVVKFTITQQVKGKSFKVSTIIILLAVAIMTSLVNIIPAIQDKKANNKETVNSEEAEFKINTAYYNDNSGLNIDISNDIKNSFKDLELINTSDSKEIASEKLKDTEENMVYIYVSKGELGYSVELLKPGNDKIVKADAKVLVGAVSSSLDAGRLIGAGVNPEALQNVMAPIETDILEAKDATITMEERIMKTILPMVACFLLFYIIYFYGYWVANSIVAEKTSRVMELLLTSTKAMELLVGKCVGMGLLAISQFATIILTVILSLKISGQLAQKLIFEGAKAIDITGIIAKIPLMQMIAVIVFFILGYVLYSILNALVGATVSKLEDLQMAMMPVTLVGIFGFYLAYAAVIAHGSKAVATAAAYIPFSSPFYIPSAILAGNAEMSQIIIGLIILIVTIVLLMLFTVRVYSVVILHTGNRVKIKDLISIFTKEQ